MDQARDECRLKYARFSHPKLVRFVSYYSFASLFESCRTSRSPNTYSVDQIVRYNLPTNTFFLSFSTSKNPPTTHSMNAVYIWTTVTLNFHSHLQPPTAKCRMRQPTVHSCKASTFSPLPTFSRLPGSLKRSDKGRKINDRDD